MKELLDILLLNKNINIFCVCKEIAFIKINGKFAIAEKIKTCLGNIINYHFMDKYDCHLVFQNYNNQLLCNNKAKLNFEILTK